MLTQRTNPSHLLYLRPTKSYPFTTATATATPTPPPPQQPLEAAALATLILTSSNPQALAQTLHSPTIQWTPQLVNTILKRLWNDGPKALQFFNLLSHHPSYSHHPSSFDHAIDISARLRDSPSLRSLIYRMRSARLGPTPKTFAIIAERGLCHRGDMERAMEFMGRMKDDGCEPNVQTYNLVIRYFCDEGEIDKALDLFQKMTSGDCLPNLDTYNILISAMFVRKKSDDLLVAGNLLIEMVDRGFVPRKFTFNRVLNGLLLTGNQGFAKEILRLQSRCGRLTRKIKL
ncbi:hypothetical protein D5086_028282 [Populus alba]|uniref:Uncharacterized protein n=1 Tax=Populus alba TaxID=43335 RepID=A0ACC4AXW7_POPAL